MANLITFAAEGQEKAVLKMTSKKPLTSNNVLYIPEIRKNLVTGSVLNKHGFELVFELDNLILSKFGMYVGKRYECNGFFKLNVMTIINKNNVTSIYLIESSNLWHGRLGHANYDSIQKLINTEHIMACRIDYSTNANNIIKQIRHGNNPVNGNTEEKVRFMCYMDNNCTYKFQRVQ